MRGKRILIIGLINLMFLNTTVYANSSWIWVTDVHPMAILPIAIVLTLLIEVMGILIINHIRKYIKGFLVICIANLFSFLIPYLMSILEARSFFCYSFKEALEKVDQSPQFIVLGGYLILTLIIEMPIVYYFIKKEVSNFKKLLISIILLNTITTIIVFILERVVCSGYYV